MNEIKRSIVTFEDIKHHDEKGIEFWYARELMVVLEYKKWDKFLNVITNAKLACEKSNNLVEDHFPQMEKMIDIGSKASRRIVDYKLSRYACYLIVQNSDPRKETVALGQTYFAVQTRKQEINEREYSELSEDEKRFYQRNLTRKGNYSLNQAHYEVGSKIRNTIKELGGTMPEDLPTPKKSLKELEKENKNVITKS